MNHAKCAPMVDVIKEAKPVLSREELQRRILQQTKSIERLSKPQYYGIVSDNMSIATKTSAWSRRTTNPHHVECHRSPFTTAFVPPKFMKNRFRLAFHANGGMTMKELETEQANQRRLEAIRLQQEHDNDPEVIRKREELRVIKRLAEME